MVGKKGDGKGRQLASTVKDKERSGGSFSSAAFTASSRKTRDNKFHFSLVSLVFPGHPARQTPGVSAENPISSCSSDKVNKWTTNTETGEG